jgi:uncharacterized protein
MKKALLVFLLILLCLPIAFARSGHIKLLAVTERDGEEAGVTADLYLEVRPGTGRIFIETVPLTKLDTQMSTRFAKEIACDFLDKDCNNYDFFYTVRSGSAIIGGPSAGAATTILTVAVLDNLKLDKKTTITGTINSGGLVGPIAGLNSKIDAAKEANLSRVLISKLNENENITKYADEVGMSIVGILDIEDAIYVMTGKKYKKESDLLIDENYLETMKTISDKLCARAEKISSNYSSRHDENMSFVKSAKDNMDRGMELIKAKKYYSAASYCFGANVKYRFLVMRNISSEELQKGLESANKDIMKYDNFVNKKNISTLTDLQAFMIVKERIREAEQNLKEAEEFYEDNKTQTSIYDLAFAIERLNSAKTWAEFFDKPGKKYDISEETLKASCLNKLSEAEERYQYALIYIPSTLSGIRDEIDVANKDYENKDYDLCLFKASKAKAEADLILTATGVSQDQTKELIDVKLESIRKIIARNDNFFPILGYSYYEYASVLRDDDPYSSLIYAEYASELSNLDIYFRIEKRNIWAYFDLDYLYLFFFGAAFGFTVCAILVVLYNKPRKIDKKKKTRHKANSVQKRDN